MPSNLLVAVMGNRNSGKTTTWNDLFGRVVRTGTELRRLDLNAREHVEVFLVSGSFEERKLYVEDVVPSDNPRIVLCSIQYHPDVLDTVDYFADNGYRLFVQWLNPGHDDAAMYFDHLGLVPRLLERGALLSIRNGQVDTAGRVREIKDYISGWAWSRGLVHSDNA